MTEKFRARVASALIVSVVGVTTLSATPAQRETDFEYRCVAVDTLTGADQLETLPEDVANVPVGNSFYVEFWATDSGGTNTGITSAYADLDYPESCVSAGTIGHTDLFSLFPDGTDDGSVIDELGGSQLDSGIGVAPEWARVAYVEFTCDEPCGSVDFQLTAATSESSAFNRGLIPTSDILYGSCSVFCGEPPPIPAVSEWGLVILTLLGLSAGTILFRYAPS